MKRHEIPRTRRLRGYRLLTLVVAIVLLSGCGVSAGTSSTEQNPAGTPDPTATVATVSSPSTQANSARASTTRPRRVGGRHAGLVYSTAPARTVQPQPSPGSCHAIGSGLYSRPDPRCTPGALNPAVTQATIGHTICRTGWTSTVRPPTSVTDAEKRASMAAYGDSGPTSNYEYDHFVSLELGGAVNDARNLWPEPGASPNPKDAVEDELHRSVCHGQMTLAQAQHAIVTNWVALAKPGPAGAPSRPTSASSTLRPAPPPGGTRCTVTASYNNRYRDYDVYVHSNRPHQTVTVTDATGRMATWHTDASGYADVYFRGAPDAAGERITAHVGGASCHATL